MQTTHNGVEIKKSMLDIFSIVAAILFSKTDSTQNIADRIKKMPFFSFIFFPYNLIKFPMQK